MLKRTMPFVLLGLLFLSFDYQQFSGFSNKPVDYPSDIKIIYGHSLSDQEKKVVDKFTKDWTLKVYDSIEKVQIVALSQLMFDNKSRNTQFKQLLTLIMAFKDSPNAAEKYRIWLNYMPTYVAMKRNTPFIVSNFLDNITHLISENNVFYNSALQWHNSRSDYKFTIRNDSFLVTFPKGDLKCYSKHDSIAIQQTEGIYSPFDRKWIGQGGIVTWERAKYKPTEVFVELKKYKLDMTRSEYKADSVLFTYQKYFAKPVWGQLNDNVMRLQNPEAAIYPEFITYNKRYVFHNLYENVDYDGGFLMRGAKIIGSGSATEDAQIIIRKGDKVLMDVRSKYFTMRPERINSMNSAIKINLQKDSIYHPNVQFIYNVSQKEVNLIRTDDFASKCPYYNSYHKVDMDFEQLNWRIDQPKISLTMGRASAIGKAKFDSQSYFKKLQYEALQGRDFVHPLVSLSNYSKMIGSDNFAAMGFIDYMGREINQVKQVLMYMAQLGYIYYNSETDIITIKQRLTDCLKYNSALIDFDVVSLLSTTHAPMENATLNMENYDLVINGIPKIAVSDSQSVAIYPDRNQIIMKENRSFQFDGVVDVGYFTFYGKNLFFDYTNFKINLQNVDSAVIRVPTGKLDNFGQPIIQKLKSVIEQLTGEVLIDRPDNKSGRKHYSRYPQFISRENSYVYYYSNSIEHGAYPPDMFNFQIYPFTMDSLNSVTKEALRFKGKFVSADIFPPMEELLTVQPDYSLGFIHSTGPEGMPVYNKKGRLFADINLSHAGLHAGGKLSYLTSTTISKDYKFYPDSMNTMSDQFTIERQTGEIEYPQADGKQNYIQWLPTNGKNQMAVHMAKDPFSMFNKRVSLMGDLALNPAGLNGSGFAGVKTAELHSKVYKFKSEVFDADTAKFTLKSVLSEKAVVSEENVASHIDFNKLDGEFTANNEYTRVDFPANKYFSFIDYFRWDMQRETVEMGSSKRADTTDRIVGKADIEARFHNDEEKTGARYISIDPKQDSLNFVSKAAIYDYKKNQIRADGVKIIRTADAVIYPSDEKVVISDMGRMDTIRNTKIVAGYENRYHTFYSATASILGRKKFTGKGKYDFMNETDTAQVVTIKDIHVDSAMHTVAKAEVFESDKFMLSPYFPFQGKLAINSTKPLIDFAGGVTITSPCDRIKPQWLQFAAEIDPKNIYIPISDEPVSINNKKLYSGLFIASDSVHIYPAFLSGRHSFSDQYITTASGFLTYNKFLSKYEIGSKEKITYRDTTGSYLSLKTDNCVEYGEGLLNLGVEFGQANITTYGTTSYDTPKNEVTFDVSMGVNFPFDESAMNLMAARIDSFPNLKPFDLKQPVFAKALNEIIGRTKADKYVDEIKTAKVKEIPTEVNYTINLSQLKLKWNGERRSYQSVGQIGIGSILKYQVNRVVDGYVEIFKKRTGDLMDIYLKLDNNTFFYFGYSKGVMQALSSYDQFSAFINKLSAKARQQYVEKGQTPYIYMAASDSKMATFLRDYKRMLDKQKADLAPPAAAEPEKVVPPETAPTPATPAPEENKAKDTEAKPTN